MYRILVVGSDGYIGQNLLNHLNNVRQTEVICVDKMYSGKGFYLGYDYNYISDYALGTIDACVFLAALSGIKYCNENPDIAIQENVLKPISFFEKLEKHKIFTIFSSSQAAKNPSSSVYAYSKKILEEKLLSQSNENIILRFSNVYGGSNYLGKKDSVISKFINDVNENNEITINGDGEQIRNFVHVDYVCSIIKDFLFLKNIPKNWLKTPLDLGYEQSISINDLAKYITKIKKNVNLNYNKDGFVGVKNPAPLDLDWINQLDKNISNFESTKAYILENILVS